MNRLLLCASLLLFAARTTAQKLEVGISGGYSYSTSLESPSNQLVVYSQPVSKSPAFAIKASYTWKKWQYGLALEDKKTQYFDSPPYACVLWYFTDPAEYNKTHMLLEEGQSVFIPMRFFVNRQFSFNRFAIYGGPSVNYSFFKNNREKYLSFDRYGLGAGLQVGASYAVFKRITINAQVGGDRIWFKRDDYTFKFYNYTTSIGLNYRLK